MSGQMNAQQQVQQFDSAWNNHNLEQIMGAFADDCVMQLHPGFPAMPDTFQGKAQVRGFVVSMLPGFHVDSSDASTDGNVLTWKAAVSSDAFRQMGVNTLDCDARATFNGSGQVQRFDLSWSPDMVPQIAGAQRDPR